MLVVLPGLRGVAAEVEGETACFRGIDFGAEVGLADSWGARVPSGRGGVGWLLCRR